MEGIVDRFINYLSAEKQYSKLTVRAYYDDICQFLLYIDVEESEFELKDISPTELRSFIMHLSKRGLKNSTINRKISTIKSLFSYGMRFGEINSDPTKKITLLKRQKTLPVFVPLSDMEQAGENFLSITNDYRRERDTLLFLMIYATGIRISELISIKVGDISFSSMEIKVTGKGNKQRVIPLMSCLEEKIKNLIKLSQKIFNLENKSLFLSMKGRTISRSDTYRTINQLLCNIGVSGKRSPHVLRHTFATHLLNNGAGIESVRELLGHSNLSATQIYTHNNIGILVEKYKDAHPRAKNK